MTTRRPLTSRPMDLVYFIYFVIHIPASLIIDFQTLYPTFILPDFVAAIPRLYFDTYGDPLIGGAMGYLGAKPELAWFKSFLVLELIFQFPVFFISARGLWNDSKSVYILILVYAASTNMTVLACLATLFATPITTDELHAPGAITSWQLFMLLQSYAPFFILTLVMTIEMAFRCHKLVLKAVRMEGVAKTK